MDKSALRILFVANGLVYRARTSLAKTPKPWPLSVREANKLLAQCQGMLTDYWKEQSHAAKAEAVGSTATDDVALADTARNDLHG